MIPVEAIFSPQSLRGHRENLIGGKPSVETAEFTTISTSPSHGLEIHGPRITLRTLRSNRSLSRFFAKSLSRHAIGVIAQSGPSSRVPGTGYRVPGTILPRPTPYALRTAFHGLSPHSPPNAPNSRQGSACELRSRSSIQVLRSIFSMFIKPSNRLKAESSPTYRHWQKSASA